MAGVHDLRGRGHRDGHRLRAAVEGDHAALGHCSDHGGRGAARGRSVADDVVRVAGVHRPGRARHERVAIWVARGGECLCGGGLGGARGRRCGLRRRCLRGLASRRTRRRQRRIVRAAVFAQAVSARPAATAAIPAAMPRMSGMGQMLVVPLMPPWPSSQGKLARPGAQPARTLLLSGRERLHQVECEARPAWPETWLVAVLSQVRVESVGPTGPGGSSGSPRRPRWGSTRRQRRTAGPARAGSPPRARRRSPGGPGSRGGSTAVPRVPPRAPSGSSITSGGICSAV